MERLTIDNIDCMSKFCTAENCVNYESDGCCSFERYRKLAYYEDLEEQGRLLVLPCNIGATIYQTRYKCTCMAGHRYLHGTCELPIECTKCPQVKVDRWIRETSFSLSMLDRIGIDFFVTREEAEKALECDEK